MLAGSAVTVGLPFLDSQLNTNGDAIAATGARIPLDELRYWSVDMQEAYASPEQALQRARGPAQLLQGLPHVPQLISALLQPSVQQLKGMRGPFSVLHEMVVLSRMPPPLPRLAEPFHVGTSGGRPT